MEKDEFIELLPRLIKDDDTVKGAIISALSNVVATKDNIEQVIRESRRQFKDIYKRLDKLEARIGSLIEQMNKGFEEARKSRERIIEQMNKGFEEARRSREAMFEEARTSREAMFEEARKSRERIIEQMNKGFEEARRSREAMFEEARTSREAMFEEARKSRERIIEQMNKGFEEARKDRKSLRTFIATVSTQSGPRLENLILEVLEDELIQENIQRSNISKIDLKDSQGEIYYKNYTTDIDVVIQDGKTILIEVKSKADNRDIYDLLKKAQLYKLQYAKDYDELFLVCLEINRFNFKQAIQQNVKVIAGEIT